MANFDTAMTYVLENEGGFANNPADRGGPTNFGISTATYSKVLGRPATVDDIKNIAPKTVKDIYQQLYWNLIKADAIKDQSMATYLMDMAVLMGPVSAAKLAQASLNIKADGIIGPVSLGKMNTTSPAVFALVFSKACIRALVQIVVRNPTQLVFLDQWVNRADDMTNIQVA